MERGGKQLISAIPYLFQQRYNRPKILYFLSSSLMPRIICQGLRYLSIPSTFIAHPRSAFFRHVTFLFFYLTSRARPFRSRFWRRKCLEHFRNSQNAVTRRWYFIRMLDSRILRTFNTSALRSNVERAYSSSLLKFILACSRNRPAH